MNHWLRQTFWILVYLFALVGFGLTAGWLAVKWGWTNTAGLVDRDFSPAAVNLSQLGWNQGEEWDTLADALTKDQVVIERVARETGLPGRLIVAMIVPEQLRLFHSEREIFKQVFSPLKILGNQTQFSWGVAGLKQETAKEIEERDETGLLAFQTDNPDKERFLRIADEHDHYYAYLYTALFLKEIMAEWRDAGFPIDDRPEILGTLFNIGFKNSVPKSRPLVGGSEIEIGDRTYSFGALAYEFYQSAELTDAFPR